MIKLLYPYVRRVLLFVMLLIGCTSIVEGQPTLKMSKHIPNVEQWIQKCFAKGKIPPFSFVCGGKSSNDFIKEWTYTCQKLEKDVESDVVEYSFTYRNPVNGLEVECVVKGYPNYNGVEWVLHFTNGGLSNSPVIEQVKVIDLAMQYRSKGDFILHYCEGNHITKYDFHPRSVRLVPGQSKVMFPEGGRSSEGDYLPFFNIQSPDAQGVILSIGWTGTWLASLTADDSRAVTMSAGMKTMKTFLYPKEKIRTPSISLMFWEGENRMIGQNKFRRFVLAHNSRKINGKLAEYPLSSGFNYHDPEPCQEYSCITADYASAMVKRYFQFGLKPEVFWLDAGWNTDASDYEHGKTWANTAGNWTVDSVRFPKGLLPIADVIHKNGAKFMVWFEPERVVDGTQWVVEHPDWMLDIKKHKDEKSWRLFDLGNPDACSWLGKYIGDMLEKNGIDYYRQDCNIEPADYWAENDEPDRIGMKEIRHIEGLYNFWDYLLKRFPKLLIDNCASGGRRLDWETIGRSAPLWRSDYYHYYDTDGLQCQTYGLDFFLPIHGTGVVHTDSYSLRSSLSTALIFNWKVTTKESSIPDMQRCLKEFYDVRPYYYEDYYPLTGIEDITKDNIWLAYQFYRPSDDSGIVVAFRRMNAQEKEVFVHLSGVNPTQQYKVTNVDTKESNVYSGNELINHFRLFLENPHSSLLLKYEAIKNTQK